MSFDAIAALGVQSTDGLTPLACVGSRSNRVGRLEWGGEVRLSDE